MKLSRRTKAITLTGLVIAMSGTAFAAQQALTTGAEEPHPIIEQVGEHEVRIDSLEGRADQTETKVEQNSADIQVVQQETGVAPAAPRALSSESTPTASAPAPTAEPVAPIPAPEPPKDPRLIVGVTDTPSAPGMHACDYALHDPRQNVTTFIQPVDRPCLAVGEVLPYV